MSRPRVLEVVRPVDGGIRVHLRNLLENMSEHFHFVVACPPDAADDLSVPGVEIFPVSLGKGLQPGGDMKTVWHLVGKLRRQPFALVHAHGFKAGLVARPAARIARVPCLVTIHNDFAQADLSRIRTLYLAAEHSLSHWTAFYITVSDCLAGRLSSTCGIRREKIRVIPNGIELGAVDRQHCELPFSQGTPLVGTVARLAPQKGVEYFIRAAAELRRENPALRFLVVGEGPLRPELEALAQQLDLAGLLYFTGYRRDVPAILARLSAYVQPSLSEGQGITVLEAMAAGIPVVATAVGGLQEMISHGKNGLLVEPGSASGLSSAVSAILNDRPLSKELTEQALSFVLRFDKKTMIERTRLLYHEAIGSGWSV
jgi:glycosyltransferase involved in cell wall biosynthesis